jgi:putative transposase
MPRSPRIVIPGIPHHVTHRGNNKQNIFFKPDDRDVYLNLLKKYSGKYGLDILGYCLMTNHVHIIGIPENEDSLSPAIGFTHSSYAQYINFKYDRIGHLFTARFKSFYFEEFYSSPVFCYIELNPGRADIAVNATDYQWSSARAHATGVDPVGIINMTWWLDRFDPESWHEYLQNRMDDIEVNAIKDCIRKGLPSLYIPYKTIPNSESVVA